MKPLVLVGPTAAGKSALALALAETWGATVVSMDAMMVYRGMDIGTAKPSLEERARVPHHGIDVRNPDEEHSAADFVTMADAVIATGVPVIVCGGTTFYLRAFLDGLVPAPPVDARLRAELEALADPWARLAELDPALAARLHRNDRGRLVRGLEFHALTGRRLSDEHAGHVRIRRDVEILMVDAEDLYDRIDARVTSMIAQGYLEEVRGLLARGYHRGLRPMRTLGYEHLAAHLEGELSLDEAVRLTQRDTRHFARKQRGFLRGFGLSAGGDPSAAARRAFG